MINAFLYKISINIKFGNLDPVIQWCKQFCMGEWNFRMDSFAGFNTPGVYDFWFQDERDYLRFTLRWL